MNASFAFGLAPAAGSRVVWISRQGSARITPDAEIALVVLGKMTDAIRVRVIPNLLPLPVREEAHLPKRFARGETVKLELLEIFARGGLFAAQSSEPDVEWFQSAEERLDFAQLAAAGGIGLVKNAECRLLFLDRLFREDVDEMQRPLLRHRVAVFVGLREMIAGIQKQHGHV